MNATSGKAEAPAQSSTHRSVSVVRVKIILLVLIGCAHLVITWSTIMPGYLLIDEAIYHVMMKNFSETLGFEIWTGYREFPSLELVHFFLRLHDGRIVCQYPYLYPLISLPFYRAVGFYGLFLMNSILFIGLVGLVFATAEKLFRDLNLALNACFVLIFATFAWEYSQAAWPHITSISFTTAAFYLAVYAYYSERKSTALITAVGAGLVAGFGTGIRLDVFLVLPCMWAIFLFTRPWRPLEAALIGVGAVPGLVVLAWTNSLKFGVFSPFAYGTSHGGYAQSVPVGIVLGISTVAATVWLATRTRGIEFLRTRKGRLIGLAAAGIVLFAMVTALITIPRVGKIVSNTVNTGYQAVVDMRAVPMSTRLPAMGRTEGGGVVYIGGLKKSVLQSMPYLVLLIIPLLRIVRKDKESCQLAMLFLVPAINVFFYSYFRYEYGGLCLNYRFLLPLLPFTSILCAYGMRDMARRWGLPFSWFMIAVIAVVTALTYYFFTEEIFVSIARLEFPMLIVPLIMAFVLAGFLLLGELERGGGLHLVRGAAWVVLIMAMTWSGVVAFGYDYPRHRLQRVSNFKSGALMLKLIPPDSLFITYPYIDAFMRLIEADRVRIVFPAQDRFKDMPKIIQYYLNKGKRVFAAFPTGVWLSLKAGPLAPYNIKPVWRFSTGLIGEIVGKESRK